MKGEKQVPGLPNTVLQRGGQDSRAGEAETGGIGEWEMQVPYLPTTVL